ncbi:hypothetical protein [Pseudoduganella umbonata]|uniref:Uncharacterized protein n=1 Tax=Pseudoduganella umbonata TaxID=864828 RepID=A0A4P8HLW7_9BURK|nr:hypothetical protein [Pseudoduganella umbonata]MBB3224902.1 hypothetical protein [Pseudoduganella umbonata]QCP09185.1 hypothetical protein FCL38_01070 [Pseudoduganella umbonata]
MLTAQHLQVGLVYKNMLGAAEAESYLRSVGIAPHLIYRLLYSEEHRPLQQVPPGQSGDAKEN